MPLERRITDTTLPQRLTEVSALWNWLPTFRAVAETQHVGKAATALRISPPAVSRTIKLLEQHLGVQLFERSGRAIELNGAGGQLLAQPREALRLGDEGRSAVRCESLAGPVVVSTMASLATTFILPAVEVLAEDHPDLSIHVYNYTVDQALTYLRRGHVDVGLYHGLGELDGLVVEPLCTTGTAVFNLTVEIAGLSELSRVLHRLSSVSGVNDVRRTH